MVLKKFSVLIVQQLIYYAKTMLKEKKSIDLKSKNDILILYSQKYHSERSHEEEEKFKKG